MASRRAAASLQLLEQTKQASTLQLLFKCARLVNDVAVSRGARRGARVQLRAAHTWLLPHVDLDGTRSTELARRVGISKQAVGQLVDDLVQLRVLERVADPSDGRAKLVRFTAHGRRQIHAGLALLAELGAELEGHVGSKRMKALHDALAAILEVLARSDVR